MAMEITDLASTFSASVIWCSTKNSFTIIEQGMWSWGPVHNELLLQP